MKNCEHCKKEKRIVAKGLCNACYCQKRYRDNPEKYREFAKVSYHKHSEKKADQRALRKEGIRDYSYEYVRRDESKRRAREYYHSHKKEILEKAVEIRRSFSWKFSAGRSAARRRGLSWGLAFDQFTDLVSRPCFYCKSDLADNIGVCLDRLDNSKGYELSNVVPCCGDCNKIRMNRLTHEEMAVAMAAVLKFRRSISCLSPSM